MAVTWYTKKRYNFAAVSLHLTAQNWFTAVVYGTIYVCQISSKSTHNNKTVTHKIRATYSNARSSHCFDSKMSGLWTMHRQQRIHIINVSYDHIICHLNQHM